MIKFHVSLEFVAEKTKRKPFYCKLTIASLNWKELFSNCSVILDINLFTPTHYLIFTSPGAKGCQYIRKTGPESHSDMSVKASLSASSRTAWYVQLQASLQLAQRWVFVNYLMSIKAAIVRDSVSSADVPMRIFFRKSSTARHAEVSEAVTSLVLTLFYFIYYRLLPFPPCSPLIVKRTIC